MPLGVGQVAIIRWVAALTAATHHHAMDKHGLTLFDMPGIALKVGIPPLGWNRTTDQVATMTLPEHDDGIRLLREELHALGIEGEQIEELGAELYEGFWRLSRFVVSASLATGFSSTVIPKAPVNIWTAPTQSAEIRYTESPLKVEPQDRLAVRPQFQSRQYRATE